METVQTLQATLGWCTVINIALLAVSTIGLVLMHKSIAGFHAKLFDLDQADLSRAYFQYLAQYKIVTLAFNLVPYVALRLATASG